jgi:cell division septation protein DedD
VTGTALAVLAAGAALGPGPAAAQVGDLDAVEALAAAGRVADARVALEDWWDGWRDEASRLDRQRAIWLRGVLTVDLSLAEMDFQRLALEFPGGPYTAGALLRLGHAAQARDDLVTAAGYFEGVSRDYPGTSEATEADQWLQRWDVLVTEARARALAAEAAAGAGAAGAAAGVPGDPIPTEPEAAPSEPDMEQEDRTGEYAVQLGAFRSVDRARIVEERARSAGLAPRIVMVEGSELIRIRVGWYQTSRSATEAMREIRELGLEAAVVRDAQRERPVS